MDPSTLGPTVDAARLRVKADFLAAFQWPGDPVTRTLSPEAKKIMPVKTMPLSKENLEGQALDEFFLKTLPARTPPGKFYVVGRGYVGKGSAAGTLVLLHFGNQVVVHARLQPGWRRRNDDPVGQPKSKLMYLFQDIHLLKSPMSVADLPTGWQTKWKRGNFDRYPRTLDDRHEAEFLAKAR